MKASAAAMAVMILSLVGTSVARAAFTPPQAGTGCLNLAAFLSQLRALPDSLYMHHQLADLSVQATTDGAQVSDLAKQHALDLFYHPNLVTLGLAAGKSGGSYLHDFTAYQLDCAKVVTGDIFAPEGMSVIWEVVSHDGSSLTLKRLTSGGSAEVNGDLTVVLRRFQAFAPTAFAVTSVYALKTTHACTPAPVTEVDAAQVTELFTIDSSAQDPADLASDDLKALMAKYPRQPAPAGHRGPFARPIVPASDPACKAPAP
jgi:hypothetical protein